jgi:hypothetical protein
MIMDRTCRFLSEVLSFELDNRRYYARMEPDVPALA